MSGVHPQVGSPGLALDPSDGSACWGAEGAVGIRLGAPAMAAAGGNQGGGPDELRTVWSRRRVGLPRLAVDEADCGPTTPPGGPGALPEATSPASVSASSSEADSSARSALQQSGSGGSRHHPGPSKAGKAVPNAARARPGTRRRGRGPARCRRCGRFLKSESWFSTLKRTVSKSLTRSPWARRRECPGCYRPFRKQGRLGLRRASAAGRGRSRSRGRSQSKRRSRPRSRSRSRSRSQRRTSSRSRSTRRRRKRRSEDDQKFFVC